MAVVYFDASALVKLVIEEDGSDLASDLWNGCDAAVSSWLSYAEVRAALAAAHRTHRLNDADLDTAVRAWDDSWPAIRPVALTRSISQRAGTLVGEHSLRGADGVHLASALAVEATNPIFAVWDHRLHAGANALGLPLVPAVL